MQWKVIILDTNATTVRATYTNASPGGIVSSIQFDLEPNGNCLTASFDGIPSQLDIQPRDMCQIYVDDMVNPKWYGYFTNNPHPLSKEVFTYSLEGAKNLLYNTTIDEFYMRATPATADPTQADLLVTHFDLIEQVAGFLPAFVLPDFENNASTTIGNVSPIVVTDYSLGQLLDDICGSSFEEAMTWGVRGNKEAFIGPAGDTSIDVTALRNLTEYGEESVDATVTAVTFVFSVPEVYLKPEHRGLKRARDLKIVDDGERRSRTNYEDRPLSHRYVDTAAVSKYGKFTKIVPLVLSDTWLKEVSVTEWLTRQTSLSVVFENTTGWRTHTGGTTAAALLSASTDGTRATSVRADSIEVAPLRRIGRLSFRRTVTAATTALDDIIGFRSTFDKRLDTTAFFWSANWVYSGSHITDQSIPDNPMDDYTEWVEDMDGSFSTYYDVTESFIVPRRSLMDFNIHPNTEDVNGNKAQDLRRFDIEFGYIGSTDTSGTFRLYNVSLLRLDTDRLEEFAKSLIKTPAEYPSIVTLQEDPGDAFVAIVLDRNGDPIEVPVVRKSYSVSRERGFSVELVLGYDEQRESEFLSRMIERDERARNQAFAAAAGRV